MKVQMIPFVPVVLFYAADPNRRPARRYSASTLGARYHRIDATNRNSFEGRGGRKGRTRSLREEILSCVRGRLFAGARRLLGFNPSTADVPRSLANFLTGQKPSP